MSYFIMISVYDYTTTEMAWNIVIWDMLRIATFNTALIFTGTHLQSP